MSRSHHSMPARREEVLPYLERLRDHYAIPMVLVSHQFDEVLRLATQLVVLDAGRVVATGDLGTVSLAPALRDIVGPEAVGAVLEGNVTHADAGQDLANVAIGTQNSLKVSARGLAPGQRVRLQLLARDLILALGEPQGISVRNHLRGVVRAITADGSADLVEVDIGGATFAVTRDHCRDARAGTGAGDGLGGTGEVRVRQPACTGAARALKRRSRRGRGHTSPARRPWSVRGCTSSLSIISPSMSMTSMERSRHASFSPVTGMRPRCQSTKPAMVL